MFNVYLTEMLESLFLFPIIGLQNLELTIQSTSNLINPSPMMAKGNSSTSCRQGPTISTTHRYPKTFSAIIRGCLISLCPWFDQQSQAKRPFLLQVTLAIAIFIIMTSPLSYLTLVGIFSLQLLYQLPCFYCGLLSGFIDIFSYLPFSFPFPFF